MKTLILDGQKYMLVPINSFILSTTADKRKKLSDEDVEAIRGKYDLGVATQAMLAQEYDVSQGSISLIINQKSRHVV